MLPLKQLLTSTVSKKYFMAVSGLALTGFVLVHLMGNLTLLMPTGDLFNQYAHHLESLGPLLYVAELGLLGILAVHVAIGLLVTLSAMQARPVGYSMEATKGGNSKNNLSSKHMAILGLGVLAFIGLHLWHFKFGAHYETVIDGIAVRDLHKLVVEEFHKPLWVLVYAGFMLVLGLHLRHGFWSAFQSLGAMPRRYSNCIYAVGVLLGVLLALGFMLLPIWIYLDPLGVAK
jgi:succinate dehydrogenase / fumarate reductase cytochrome b subunit